MGKYLWTLVVAFSVSLPGFVGCGGGGGGGDGGGEHVVSWGAPSLIGTGGAPGVSSPQVAFDPAGNAIAVWHSSDGTKYDIYANRYDASGGWGTAVTLESADGNGFYPQVAFDQSGNAIAVWQQKDGSSYSIYANRYVAGAGWGTPVALDNLGGEASLPQIAIDQSGSAIAVWYQYDGVAYSIYANRYVAGTGWGSAIALESLAGHAFTLQAAVDQSGNIMVVWAQSDGATQSIYAKRFASGVGWGSAEVIENYADLSYAPRIAIAKNGNALAVWCQNVGASTTVSSNSYDPVNGWGTAASIDDTNGELGNPQIAFDGEGNAIAVWDQDFYGSSRICANRYIAGSGWNLFRIIDSVVSQDSIAPDIAFDQSGNATIVWQQSDGSRTSIWSNRHLAATGWGEPELVERDDTEGADSPQVAVDPSGNILAVWHQLDSNSQGIWANFYR